VLTAPNTYSGPTTISAGTLVLGNGGSILGNVVDNGTFAVNRSDAYTFSGAISGSGSFVQMGTGTTTLSANSTYTGPTTVSAGTLVVNGSIANSAVTVDAGAALTGTGTVGATTIRSGGIFAPGSVGMPGPMTVFGNLVFQSGALYLAQITSSSASIANVTGAASLAGTVAVLFFSESFTRSYSVLSAAGGFNGSAFSALATTNLPAGFAPALSYTTTDVVVNLTAVLGQGAGLSQNQQNAAGALNNFFNNGGTLPGGFVSIFRLTGSNLGNMLSQVSGEAATGARQVGFQSESQFLNLMLDPFVDGRTGLAGTSGPALGFAPERDEALPDDVALAYSKVFKEPPAKAPTFDQRWSAWGGAYGGGNRTSGDPAVVGSHDLSATTAGFAGGLDYRLSPSSIVGLALAGGGTGWSLAQGSVPARATRSKRASTARRARGQPISPRRSPSSITGCRATASRLPATISPRASTRRAMAGGSRAAIASPQSTAALRPMPRFKCRASARRATARPTPTAAASRFPTIPALAVIPGANSAPASTACLLFTPTLYFRSAPGSPGRTTG